MINNLIPYGKLDLDSDIYSLREGDFQNARNVVITTGKGGGNKIVKTMESIKDVGLTEVSGTLKAITTATNGDIYQLYVSGSNALIYSITSDLSQRILILQYAHEVVEDFTPDLETLGTSLFWNYHKNGVPLMWETTRTNGQTVLISSLLMGKQAPGSVLTISKSVNIANSLQVLESENFQFATLYKYDNGEYSVLSPFTNIYKGERGTEYYEISVNRVTPAFVEEIEVYARTSSGLTWRRIRTVSSGSGSISFNWRGEYFETLPTSISALSFSAIPTRVGAIETALDRVWFGDFDDDYVDNGSGAITLQSTIGKTLATGGTIKNYLGADTTAESIKSSESGTFFKPFANDSQYLVGLAFFDSSLKTRGVEYVTSIATGLFANPHNPQFSLILSGYTKPPWANFMQLCVSQNLSKINSYEGFANSIYFEIEQDETNEVGVISKVVKPSLSVRSGQESKVKFCVLDIAGLYGAGHIYTFNQGDRCYFRCKDATTGYRILNTKVIRSEVDKIYLEWNGGLCNNDETPIAKELYFEIYSPIQTGEDPNRLLYGVGNLIDISSSIPTTITNYEIGDSVWKQVSFKENTTPRLVLGFGKSVPAQILVDATFSPKTDKELTNADTVFETDLSVDQRRTFHIPFSGMGITNTDGGSIVNNSYRVEGYYDKYQMQLDFKYNLQVSSQAYSQQMEVVVTAAYSVRVVRTPFNQSTQSLGAEVTLFESSGSFTVDQDEGSGLFDISFGMSFNPSKESHKLTNGDLLKVVVDIEFTSFGGVSQIYLKNINGVGSPVFLNVIGDRIAPKRQYYNKETVTVASTDTTFAVRASSFSQYRPLTDVPGKPYLQFSQKTNGSRTNSFRHGGNYVQGSGFNEVSTFSTLDTYDVPIEHGKIYSIQRSSRLQGDGTMLLVLCENETSYVLLGEINFEGSGGDSFSALSTNLVGSIRTLEQRAGIQDKRSVYNHNGIVYWWDNSRSKVYRLNRKADVISDIDTISYFINKSGVAKFAIDPHYSMMLVNIGGTDCIAFDYARNEWRGYFDIDFDFALHKGNRCLYFRSGKVFRTLENASGNRYNEFFGATYQGRIDLVLNSITPISPYIVQVNHNMVVTDYTQPNFVRTPLLTINITNENGQATTILEPNLLFEQNKLYGYVLRDINSPLGIIEGDFLTGYNNIFSILLKNNTIENRIFALVIESQQNSGHL